MSSHHDTSKPSARVETIKSGVISPCELLFQRATQPEIYQGEDYDLQVLNDCTVELDLVTLNNLFGDHFSTGSADSHEKEYKRLLTNNKDHTSSNKKIWITNYTADQPYQTVRDRIRSTSAIDAVVQSGSHWKLDWHKEEGRLNLEEMSNGKSKGKKHSRSRSRYKRPESETGNESSSSTSGDEALGMGEIRSHRSMPSPLPGYTHSLVESQSSEMTWSGRPEPSNPLSLFVGIHKKDRTVRYYGYNLTNSTRFALWWDEIADILLSRKIIKPSSAKGPKEKGRLIEEYNMIMIQFDSSSVNPEADSLFEYINGITIDEQYPSISIRNRLRYNVAFKSILNGLGKLLREPDGEAILAKNKGEIWKLIQKSDGAYLSGPNSTQLSITIHPLAKRQSDTSSSEYFSFSEESQRSRRPESHSAHRSPPSVSSRDGSNQDRTPTQTKLKPFRAKDFALRAQNGSIKNQPDYYSESRQQHRAATSGSRSGVESGVGQDISFYHPPASSHGNSASSIHSHAQTQTAEPKEKDRKSSKFKVTKFLRIGQDSSNGREYSNRQERTRDRHMRREEEKLAKKRRKDEEREEKRVERERKLEDRKQRNRGGPPEWERNGGRGERARKSSTRGKLSFTVSIEGVGRR
ncbi:hypothetical protein BGAL_0402g00080 [Botrytis galanthina]|uniref:Uncharacterized protein n=1 Tax=Botrytis galanthina TaxID=278940 RepID=A0A4S8QXA9_9HELO|nr:hypothetical protein BGAL_0402g00080 [Botrytis galanthina]